MHTAIVVHINIFYFNVINKKRGKHQIQIFWFIGTILPRHKSALLIELVRNIEKSQITTRYHIVCNGCRN